MKKQQLYRVRIKPEFIEKERREMEAGNSVFQPSIIDGCLASLGVITEYSRGQAIKKARVFNGVIEKAPIKVPVKKQPNKKIINMKDSDKLKYRKATLRSDAILLIKEHIKRILALLKMEKPDNKTDNEIRLAEPVFVKEIDSQFSQHIHGIFTSGVAVSIDIDVAEETTEIITDFSDEVLIEILVQLEEIKTVADIEFIG